MNYADRNYFGHREQLVAHSLPGAVCNGFKTGRVRGKVRVTG